MHLPVRADANNLHRYRRTAGRPNNLSTRWMFATTSDFHDVRFFGFLAILATVFTALLRRTVAGPVGTSCSCFFSHQSRPPQRFFKRGFSSRGFSHMLGRSELQVKRIKAEYWGNYESARTI